MSYCKLWFENTLILPLHWVYIGQLRLSVHPFVYKLFLCGILPQKILFISTSDQQSMCILWILLPEKNIVTVIHSVNFLIFGEFFNYDLIFLFLVNFVNLLTCCVDILIFVKLPVSHFTFLWDAIS